MRFQIHSVFPSHNFPMGSISLSCQIDILPTTSGPPRMRQVDEFIHPGNYCTFLFLAWFHCFVLHYSCIRFGLVFSPRFGIEQMSFWLSLMLLFIHCFPVKFGNECSHFIASHPNLIQSIKNLPFVVFCREPHEAK